MRIAVISDVHASLPGPGNNPALQAGEFSGANVAAIQTFRIALER